MAPPQCPHCVDRSQVAVGAAGCSVEVVAGIGSRYAATVTAPGIASDVRWGGSHTNLDPRVKYHAPAMTTTEPRPIEDLCPEDSEDAMLDGDRVYVPGTARAALRHKDFRVIYFGAFASNIGTWMQNVVLGALAYKLSGGSPVFVGLIMFAQLGPLMLLSMVGGVMADSMDRKKILVVLTIEQGLFSAVLALVVMGSHPSEVLIFLVVLIIGIGNALYAPTFSAVLPVLVPKEDLNGAISLNSVQMNASRVVGPAIGAFMFVRWGAPSVFILNSVSYVAVIIVVLRIHIPPAIATGTQGLHRLLEGVRYSRVDRVVGRSLVTIFVFSLVCLPFITQLPTIAGHSLHIAPKSNAYGLLYGAFGLGAVVGALSIGTVFASADKARLTRLGLVGFGVMLFVFGLLRSAAPAYLVIFLVGGVYFAVITSLSTVLQVDLDNKVRGQVMALWIMGFGGTVPFGGLAGGVLMEHFGITPVITGGAIVAVALAVYARLDREAIPLEDPADPSPAPA